MSVRVRLATLDDVPDIVRLGEDYCYESNYAGLDYDPRVADITARHYIESAHYTLLLAVTQHHSTIGFIAGHTAPALFTRGVMAQEDIMLVRPESRGRIQTVKKLVWAFSRWAADQGARRITFGNSAGVVDDGAYIRFFERYGFWRSGSMMHLEV